MRERSSKCNYTKLTGHNDQTIYKDPTTINKDQEIKKRHMMYMG